MKQDIPTEKLLKNLVLSTSNPICTGFGKHHISPEFLKAWKEARDFLFPDEASRLAVIEKDAH